MQRGFARLASGLAVAGALIAPLYAQTPVIDATVATLPTALAPVGIVMAADGSHLYVLERRRAAPAGIADAGCLLPVGAPSTSTGGQIEVFDTAARARVAVLDGALFPREAATDRVRHLAYATRAGSPDIDVINTATGALLRTIATGLAEGAAFTSIDPARRRLYVAGIGADEIVNNQILNRRIRVIDLTTDQPIADTVPVTVIDAAQFTGHV